MDILNEIVKDERSLIDWQRELHTYPELSGRETRTCEMIKEKLASFDIPFVDVPDGGILAFISGEKQGKSVLLRADIDALPVAEDAENLCRPKAVVSAFDGISHACGHDAHTAMLLSAAKLLAAKRRSLAGQVILMFERGEERTCNCIKLFRYIEQNHIKVDSAFAVHMYAALESGKLAINDGPVMASNFCFDVKIKGKSGHGAYPHTAINPIDCFAAAYQAMQSMRMRKISPYHPFTLTVGQLQAGVTNNIVPDELFFRGAIRFYYKEDVEIFRAELDRILAETSAAYGCTYEYTLQRGPCKPVINDHACAMLARDAIGAAVGAERISATDPQLLSETFGKASCMWPGVYLLLGTNHPEKGMGAEHHHPKFEIDSEVLKYGAAAYAAYAQAFLSSDISTEGRGYRGSFAEMYAEQGVPPQFVAYLSGELEDLDLG